MALADLGAVTSAALLIAAVIATATGLFWATAALERWLDAIPNRNAAVPSTGAGSPSAPRDAGSVRIDDVRNSDDL